jgi:hypothetical protein
VTADPEVLLRLARESGELLGELGVRPEDSRWIREHAETIASLAGRKRRASPFDYFVRLARKAARKAR